MAGRAWNKFHPVFGPDLKVGFETTFPREAEPKDLDPLYRITGLIHDSPSETTVRIYEPARVFGSCRDGREAQVLFVPAAQKESLFRRLVFARKIGDDRQPRLWMAAARHEEAVPFGFDALNSKSPRYLVLAYPGTEDGEFTPAYVKIRTSDGQFIYLELWADDDEVQILITARHVNEDEAPEHLLLATPWEKRK